MRGRVEEVGSAQATVALRVAGVDSRGVDVDVEQLRVVRRGVVELEGALPGGEDAVDPGDEQVANRD